MQRVVALVGSSWASDAASIDAIDPYIRQQLEGRVELVTLASAEAEAQSRPVEGVLTLAHAPVDARLLDRISPKGTLKVVANYGVGVDHFNLEDLKSRKVPASNTPDVLSGATADLGFALLMACARRIAESLIINKEGVVVDELRILSPPSSQTASFRKLFNPPALHPQSDRYCRSGAYTSYDNLLLLGTDVHHKTIGIIGMGRIGTEVAHRARGFHMKVLYHNRTRRPEVEKELGAQLVDLMSLLKQSDFVMLTCPYTKDTHHLLKKSEFEVMKPTAILVNIARGTVVKTEDLVEALRKGTLAFAGLDVTDPEPLPIDHPLTKMDNVIMTPHRGSATRETRRYVADLMLQNLFLGLEGKALRTPLW